MEAAQAVADGLRRDAGAGRDRQLLLQHDPDMVPVPDEVLRAELALIGQLAVVLGVHPRVTGGVGADDLIEAAHRASSRTAMSTA